MALFTKRCFWVLVLAAQSGRCGSLDRRRSREARRADIGRLAARDARERRPGVRCGHEGPREILVFRFHPAVVPQSFQRVKRRTVRRICGDSLWGLVGTFGPFSFRTGVNRTESVQPNPGLNPMGALGFHE